MTASFVLTQTAASAPLAGAWDGVEDGLISVSRSLRRFLPTGGSTRPVGIAFGPNSQVQQQWTTSNERGGDDPAQPDRRRRLLLAGDTYDQIDLKGWGQSTSTSIDIPADAPILDGLADDVDPAGRHSFTFTVTPDEFTGVDDPVARRRRSASTRASD